MTRLKMSWPFAVASIAYALGLGVFYVLYVPLVGLFQAVLFPLLLLTAVLTAIRPMWGTVLFCISFPLINNLPYFFRIYEDVPQAPTALVLFLFFFLGWLARQSYARTRLFLGHPIFRPMALFSLLIVISAAITIYRYTNFVPFRSDGIYELIANVVRVTAGGAIMSSVFYGLSYLSAMAFFLVLLSLLDCPKNIRILWITFLGSSLVSIVFGLYQQQINLGLGNTPLRASIGTINATFKDPNSFGAFLSLMIPVMLGLLFIRKPVVKIYSGIILVLGLFLLPATGSGSGFLGILIALGAFSLMFVGQIQKIRKSDPKVYRRALVLIAGLVVICAALLASILLGSKDSNLFLKLKLKVIDIQKGNSWDNLTHKRWDVNWQGAVDMIRDYPLTGVGLGAYTIEISNYAEIRKKSWPIGESAENYILQVGSELGLPGIVLILWIFWELLRQIKQSYQKGAWPDRTRFFLLGTIAAMISYFVNLQFHTYIGSYEMKYAFWLLAATAFYQPRNESQNVSGGSAQRALFSRPSRVAIAVGLIFLGGVHFWNSARSLSLESRTRLFGLKQEFGLDRIETDQDGREFRWTRSYGGLALKIEKSVLVIPIQASHPDIQEKPVQVQIFITRDFFRHTRLIKTVALDRGGWNDVLLSVSGEIGRDVILLLKVSRTWNPLKTTGAPDPRNLGVALGKTSFRDS